MQWVLQSFEDTDKLAKVLERLGCDYSFHKVVPFVGTLEPVPQIADFDAVVLFGSYTLWRYAEAHGLRPGVFRLRTFVHERAWQPHLLNGPKARFLRLRELPTALGEDERDWFVRPVSDSKEIAGGVKSSAELVALAQSVLSVPETDLPGGSLEHDTELMLCPPVRIQSEWRIWVVEDRVVTWSLYKERRRVVYRAELDPDALAFAERLVALNPAYARAYVMDICRTADGLHLLETNCINAAGFYAADLGRLVEAIEDLA